MNQSWRGRKPDPFQSSNPLNMEDVWKTAVADDANVRPPRPNSLEEVPYNLLIHDIDDLYNVGSAIVVDRWVAAMVLKKLQPLGKIQTRQEVQILISTSTSEIIGVNIWAIPIFSEGVMVYLLYAVDHKNRQLLKQHRNPAKPAHYDITSF